MKIIRPKLSCGLPRLRREGVPVPADAGPTQGFPRYAKTLQAELAQVVQAMHERFPNLKLVYLSSRTFAGYATTWLNPEPYAYESGFSVRLLIEQQLKGDPALNYDPAKGAVKAPWLSWGPYLWANGMTRRADGFCSEKDDFAGDGTHHAAAGVRKMGEQVLKGIAQPVRAYRVVDVSGATSRFEAATQKGLTPLVGREQELGLLLEHWALAQDGEGQGCAALWGAGHRQEPHLDCAARPA